MRSTNPLVRTGMHGFSHCALALVIGVLALPWNVSEVAGQTVEGASRLVPVMDQIEEMVSAHQGVAGISVVDLQSGERFGVREDEPFPSASIVKIPIMVDVFGQAQEGRISLEEPLTFLDIDRTDGSGVLQYLSAPMELTVWDATWLMITLSDNSATDLLLAKLSPTAINRRTADMGFPDTRLFLPAVNAGPGESPTPDQSGRFGLGVTTPREISDMLALIYHGEAVSPEASRRMLEILSYQIHEEGLPRHLPDESGVAHKTGSTPTSRNDCGIVFGPKRDFTICVMTRDNQDQSWGLQNEAYLLMGDLCLLVYRALNPVDSDLPGDDG